MKKAPALAPGIIIAVLLVAQIAFVAGYITHERTIYFWDHAMYFSMAGQAYGLFTQDFSDGWNAFRNSLAHEYNLIFTIPSLIGFALFGVSRLVFIVSNFVAFFLAYEVALAYLLRALPGFDWTKTLILSLLAGSFIPPVWLPLLEGYPDIGAAACIALAAGLFLRGFENPQSIAKACLSGVILGCAVLLRRHFVYPALALLLTSGGFSFVQIWQAPQNWGPRLARLALTYLACGLGFAGILFLVAPDFVITALTVNFSKLYFSYQRPIPAFLRFVLGGFGIGLLLVGAGGMVLLGRRGIAEKRAALFLTIFTFVWLAVWCLGPDQFGHHYMLHALPLFISAGFAGWVVYAGADRKKLGGIAVLAVLLFANSAWALWLSPTGVWPNDNGRPGLLSAARPPVVRSDYDEYVRLADYVRRSTGLNDRIMIVGSSFVFNEDILFSVYFNILGAPEMAARFPKSPEIDHEEPAPFDVFASSTVYLVPTPAQYHLDPAGQRVVTAAANQFPPPASRASLFQADDAVFQLANGVTLKVWRRKAWNPAALHDALADIGRDGPKDSNFAQDWAASLLPVRAQIRTNSSGVTSVLGMFEAGRQKMDLFFRYPVGSGSYRIGMIAAGNCPEPHFHLELANGAGRADVKKDFAPAVVPGAVYAEFAVKNQDYLTLSLATSATTTCLAGLEDLRIERAP